MAKYHRCGDRGLAWGAKWIEAPALSVGAWTVVRATASLVDTFARVTLAVSQLERTGQKNKTKKGEGEEREMRKGLLRAEIVAERRKKIKKGG